MSTHSAGPLEPGRLILIRHGETDHNVEQRICGWTDSALSQRGARQALLLGAHVAAAYSGIDHLYASPLQRAWLTAQAIADQLGLAIERLDDLREIHFGELEGLDVAAFQERHPEIYARWSEPADLDLRWPGGESRSEFRDRVRRALTPLERESRSRRVAVVSHGGVIGSYLAHLLAGDPSRWRDYAVRNCSVTEIAWRAGVPVVVCRDMVDHLVEA
jgi:broad specificity phosphatase PhoE